MDYNFFIKISGTLLADKRLREHIDLCKQASEKAYFPQYKILCLYTLACCYKEAGDAVSNRETLTDLFKILDSDRNIIYQIPSLQEVMEDMYVKACEHMGDCAISYSEYETYMHKIEEVRPLTELQKGQLELIESLKNEGRDWTYNIISLVQRYQNDNKFGDAATLWSLLLIYRRQLRVSRDDINIAIHDYTATVFNLISECTSYCEQKKHPCHPYNYLFIVEKAIGIAGEFQKDMSTQKEANEAIEKLNSVKNHFEKRLAGGTAIYDNYTGDGYLSRNQIIEDIRENEKTVIPPGFEPAGKPEQRAAIVRSAGNLIIAGVSVYYGLYIDKTWGKVLFFILAVFSIMSALSNYTTRKFKKIKKTDKI
jgi:hypothetical protein